MEISTFELLVKRIAPASTAELEDVARRIVQGYFLTMTNLESTDLVFQLEFLISRPVPSAADRSLEGNAVMRYDIAGENQALFLYGGATTTRFATAFRLPARQTASVELLPAPGLILAPIDTASLEVRGFAMLSLPALLDLGSLNFRAQSSRPVKVLVNPEIRGTFLPNAFPTTLGGDYDQINYPLAIASGRGMNVVEAEPNFSLNIAPLTPTVRDGLRQRLVDKLAVAPTEIGKTQALVELGDLVKANPVRTPQAFSDLIDSLTVPML